MFTKNVALVDIPFEPTSPVPQKCTKVFQVDEKTVQMNIWDTLGGQDVEVTSLRQNLYPSIVG